MAEDQYDGEWQPRDAVAEAMSRLIDPSGISKDPGLTAATEAVAWAILAAVRRLHVIAYRETFEEAAARSGMTVREVADDPQAATHAMTAARLAREDEIAGLRQRAQTAIDMLVELRDGAGNAFMVDRLGLVLTALGYEETAAACAHENQKNVGTLISPLMVCADCGVQVTGSWGPGKGRDDG